MYKLYTIHLRNNVTRSVQVSNVNPFISKGMVFVIIAFRPKTYQTDLVQIFRKMYVEK